MRIAFFGSDDFARLHLEYILKSRHTVVGCVTSPDRRQGRGMQMAMSPIKILADRHHIPYIQPENLKDKTVLGQLRAFDADIFVVVAYGKLLTQDVLDIPKLFCVNVHGSLLPKYRGAAPINWAILNGEPYTGVTVQKVFLALDAGDIIAQSRMDITPGMTADVLREKMAIMSAPFLVKTLNNIEDNKYSLTPQDPMLVSYASKLTKEMGAIDWTKSAVDIERQVRGLKPWPGTFTLYKGKTLKILAAHVSPDKPMGNPKPATVLSAGKSGLAIACGEGAVIIEQVQPEAGKAMAAADFLLGHKISAGIQLK